MPENLPSEYERSRIAPEFVDPSEAHEPEDTAQEVDETESPTPEDPLPPLISPLPELEHEESEGGFAFAVPPGQRGGVPSAHGGGGCPIFTIDSIITHTASCL